jgi:protein TonB
MNIIHTNKLRSFPILTFSPILILLLCAACGNSPAPDSASAPVAQTPAAPVATGLVKNPVKLSDTADAVKWMDMASAKSPAQIAKEEQLAKAAKEAKLAAEARETKLAEDARAAKLVADARLAADARNAEQAKALAAKAEAQKLALAAAPVVTPKAAPAISQEPILKVISHEQPKFPKNAGLDGITSGLVTAQIHIEPDGRVSKVDILKATPKKYFDKAVIAAALQWKYAPISKPMTTTLEFDFKLDGDGT